MQKTVVALQLIAICSCVPSLVFSQPSLKLASVSPLPADVKKLVTDYPNRFANHRGDEIAKNPQAIEGRQ